MAFLCFKSWQTVIVSRHHQEENEKASTNYAVNRKQKSKSIIAEHKISSFIRRLISMAC